MVTVLTILWQAVGRIRRIVSRLALVGPADEPLPEALELLPHTTIRYDDIEDCLDHLDTTDVVLVDCRTEPARARETCLQLSSRESTVPVMLLASAKTLSVVTRDWGADDFLTDAATSLEADARLRFVASGHETKELVAGPFTVDEDAYTASVGGTSLDLTYTEFELLKFLVGHPGRVLTRDVLLSEVWGYDYYGGTRTVDVHIRRLRAKIGPEYEGHIQTVRSVGYRFQAQR
ncbi:winged helix-turn-helix transcriptional regulator [Acidipropionibacterium jensenii]|uniref:winged helix-turn-helix transcriptional regulator n=1 Tax=Acidipropionibacterium jensenii TaxID=1749 RepID=UPI002647C1F9|nr:response regulator transcription factor [Acidipropionibacterium jensenii]MDN5978608.1 response regulator transcription factor [Acidipropionibacterium jensenii]MDN6428132.1 response regulator transcription factor [Acidipropionibacterium jensenii]MDN6442931.1 response regulator transcription factor [Acidipropionibacterium jensenii]MDN6480846.1 response regulator transcription factor [Acidipropionibacterium jensenii]MDN6512970.1 response regulator transcription factor [Acidipropionibacterium j